MSQEKINFEQYYEMITGQLTTTLRAFEQLANLVRAGQVQINDLVPTLPVVKDSGPSQEARQQFISGIPPVTTFCEDDIPQPIDLNSSPTKETIKEVDAVYESLTEAEKMVYDSMVKHGLDRQVILDSILSLKNGTVTKNLKDQKSEKEKAAEFLIKTKEFLAHFSGPEGLLSRFVHHSQVPNGRGDLAPGSGDGVVLPLFQADPNIAKPASLLRWNEGFYIPSQSEQRTDLILRTEKFTIVFNNITKDPNPLPYIVEREGEFAEQRQPVSILSFPVLRDVYFATRDRLIVLNGADPSQFSQKP